MWTDVTDLDEFYRSPLGKMARRMIHRRIRVLWPDLRGRSLLGLGYATPYLRQFQAEADRVMAVMPAWQGVIPWPVNSPGQVALAYESELPFADASVDRILLVHAVEASEQLRDMMREAWRVLAGNGRLLVVAPNRRGIWARSERTPFGHGHPYSTGQLRQLLKQCEFTPGESARALYMPPMRRRWVLGSANAIEKVGDRVFQTFAGVVMIEAAKQVYAATPGKAVRPGRLVLLPGGAPAAQGVPGAGRLITED